MKTSTKIIIGIIAAAIIVLVVIAATKKPKEVGIEGVIKVGAALALTGDAAVWGEAEKNSIEMAVDEINKKGGIKGKKIELVIEDMKSTNQASVSSVSKLLSIDKVSYILGPTWADSYQGALPLSDQYNTIFITPDAAVTTIHADKVFPNVFSTYYRTDFQGKNYLKIAGKEDIKSIYFLVQNDPYYTDLTNYIQEKAKELGATIAFNRVPIHTVDFRTKLLEIKNKKPDMVFVGFGSDQEYSALYKQRAELGLQDIPFYDSELIAEFGPNPAFRDILKNGYYVGFEEIPGDFAEKYKERFQIDPVFAASIAYDTVYILKDAIEHTDGSTEAVRNYLESKTFDTVTFGNAGFDDIHGMTETKLNLYKYNQDIGNYEAVKQ